MTLYGIDRVTDTIDRVNAFQDRLVRTYLQPYSLTFTYWACAFVYLYIGFQKVSPHRSAADVQLGTVGGLLGIPYVPFVTFIGVWQIVIGALFLLRRLRLCALFFFTYQFFTFGTLVWLRYIVFQPPWITVFGIDIQWALGAYAAFILKNLVFAAIFFVLASIDMEASDTGEEVAP